MAKIIVGLVLMLMTLLSFQAWAEFPPKDFRGVKWGTDISELKDMESVGKTQGLDIYQRKNDKLAIGAAVLASVYYVFYKNKFYGANLKYKGSGNQRLIQSSLDLAYGKSLKPNQFMEEYVWGASQDSFVRIVHKFSEISDSGEIFYLFMEIGKQQQADDLKSSQQGVDDL